MSKRRLEGFLLDNASSSYCINYPHYCPFLQVSSVCKTRHRNPIHPRCPVPESTLSRPQTTFISSLLLILILPVIAWAQVSTTGKITGAVTDASGSSLTTATVTVTTPSLMADRSAHVQSDGSYLFDLLPPGTYDLTATANGFQTLKQTGIVVTAGFTATVNSRLRVGQVQETIEVRGEPAVDVQSVEAQTTFDQGYLHEHGDQIRIEHIAWSGGLVLFHCRGRGGRQAADIQRFSGQLRVSDFPGA